MADESVTRPWFGSFVRRVLVPVVLVGVATGVLSGLTGWMGWAAAGPVVGALIGVAWLTGRRHPRAGGAS
ncbi:hypothetical protein HII36_51505 [Nonomuraea sp. NN258]|uniref:hypothetical protein n=1 Tax=Nonomuraea antri TaxID=2730852 RepID=UPI00156992DF|nr:hypothetical protein [Nonomuraea antri]NRQ40196.1 hypothetical protein [Nonomuraea antri]